MMYGFVHTNNINRKMPVSIRYSWDRGSRNNRLPQHLKIGIREWVKVNQDQQKISRNYNIILLIGH